MYKGKASEHMCINKVYSAHTTHCDTSQQSDRPFEQTNNTQADLPTLTQAQVTTLQVHVPLLAPTNCKAE